MKGTIHGPRTISGETARIESWTHAIWSNVLPYHDLSQSALGRFAAGTAGRRRDILIQSDEKMIGFGVFFVFFFFLRGREHYSANKGRPDCRRLTMQEGTEVTNSANRWGHMID